MKNILMLAFILFVLWKFYNDKQVVANDSVQTQQAIKQPPINRPVKAIQQPKFECDGKQHCSQMSSCAEAKYFIEHCPNTKMDGDRDGVPCEQQWCN